MLDYLALVGGILGIIQFVGYIIACKELAETAHDKGHQKVSAAVLFFLGFPYMVNVASLPDLKARSNASDNAGRYRWNCPSCGAVNPNYKGVCAECGTHKPYGD